MMLLSDYGTPVSNYFSAYGCHTFKWTNAEGKFVYIKVRTRKGKKKTDKGKNKARLICCSHSHSLSNSTIGDLTTDPSSSPLKRPR
jgi:catalase